MNDELTKLEYKIARTQNLITWRTTQNKRYSSQNCKQYHWTKSIRNSSYSSKAQVTRPNVSKHFAYFNVATNFSWWKTEIGTENAGR